MAQALHTLSLRLHLSLHLSHPPPAIQRATRHTLLSAVNAASTGTSSRGWIGIVIAVLDSPEAFDGIVHPALPPVSVRNVAEVWVERAEEHKLRKELGFAGVEDVDVEYEEEAAAEAAPVRVAAVPVTAIPSFAQPTPSTATPAAASIPTAAPTVPQAPAVPMPQPAPVPSASVFAAAPVVPAPPAIPFMSTPSVVQTKVTTTTSTTVIAADDDDEPLPELDDASSDEDME